MASRKMFTETNRTYATVKNAEKVIEKISQSKDMSKFYFSYVVQYVICATDNGRFFPMIILNDTTRMYMHYFIAQGCCVSG